MTALELLSFGENRLRTHTLDPDDALALLAYASGKSREHILAGDDDISIARQRTLDRYRQALRLRIRGYSIAVISGYKYFCGLRILINSKTLVPRPESEQIVELGAQHLNRFSKATVLDIGTGSGCIVIALARAAGANHSYAASDISRSALAIARRNARHHRVRLRLIHSDLFGHIPQTKKFDLIVANLPYLTTEQLAEPSIRKEPVLALHGGPDGLDLYCKFFSHVSDYCSGRALIIIEMDPAQTRHLQRLARLSLPKSEASVHQDLAGKDRLLHISANISR